ncbi:MAG: subtilisin family serine protease [Halioglobus sp.]|jgi:subtilisin family serine protease
MKSFNSLKLRTNKARISGLGKYRFVFDSLFALSLSLFLLLGQVAQAQLSLGGAPDVVEDSVADAVEDQVIDAAEDRVLSLGGPELVVEEAVEETVEEAVEETLEEVVETNLEETVEEAVVENIEESLEEDIEESIEQSIEEDVASIVEDSVEQGVDNNFAQMIADILEQSLAENIQEEVAQNVEENIEDSVAQNVENGIEEEVAQGVEDSVEEGVAQAVEDGIEEEVAQGIEGSVEEGVAQAVEEGIEDTVAASVEEEVAQNIEQSVEQSVATNVEQGVEENLERNIEGEVAEAVEERLESTIDLILEGVESGFEIDENRIRKDQWLVMAEPEVFDKLADEGYLFDKVTELPGIGMRLAEVAAPSSFDITEIRQGVIDVLGNDHADVDLNHIYTAGAQVPSPHGEGISPQAAISFPSDTRDLKLRIGMIDSLVDTSHPSLSRSNIHSKSFAPKTAALPNFHGTAIASIIAGSSGEYQGLAPNSELYAAAVFQRDEERGEIASTVSLVMALDWLISSGVDVINISLAGPPNRLLQSALTRAAQKNVMILAAAGNGGPVAKPMYPAAYASVVAVTAVDVQGKVFRLANRGEYLDLAAPGVSMRHAQAGGGYVASSGTSFAVPFAATAAARIRQLMPGTDALEMLHRNAQDLGSPGWDEVYGYGLLRPDVLSTSGVQTASR